MYRVKCNLFDLLASSVFLLSVMATGRVGWGLDPGAEDPASLDALIDALGHSSSDVRIKAAKELGELGDAAGRASEALAKSLEDGYPGVQCAARDALVKIGKRAVGALFEPASSQNLGVRRLAVSALAEITPVAEPATSLLHRIAKNLDEDFDVRYWSITGLGSSMDGGVDVVRTLIALLDNDHPNVRAAAARSIGRLARLPDQTIPPLIERLSDSEPNVRSAAAVALGNFGHNAAHATPHLIRLFNDSYDADDFIAKDASTALAAIGEVALPALSEALKTPFKNYQLGALASLGSMGKIATPLVPDIVAILDASNDWNVKGSAALALGVIGDAREEVLLALLKATSYDDGGVFADHVRECALISISDLGSAAASLALALVERAADEPDEGLRLQIASALTSMGPEIRPLLFDALGRENPGVRQSCLAAIASFAPYSDDERRKIMACSEDQDSKIRDMVRSILE